jgi:hypothetical protein
MESFLDERLAVDSPPDPKIYFDFSFLVPPPKEDANTETSWLSQLAQSKEHRHLLRHPELRDSIYQIISSISRDCVTIRQLYEGLVVSNILRRSFYVPEYLQYLKWFSKSVQQIVIRTLSGFCYLCQQLTYYVYSRICMIAIKMMNHSGSYQEYPSKSLVKQGGEFQIATLVKSY